ncbi:hypothetical protein AAG747_17065 [Rapidithrix thailandica]|uniref:Uncharacterized protein n=1 Tax=Rapidithrix thailandica TaxID=413964 RepID=A0AAW9S6Y6_9BACT
MKTLAKVGIITLISILGLQTYSLAQSALFVYKNENKGMGDYMCMRGMPNQQEAEYLTKQKLQELVNDEQHIFKYTSTNGKGYGIVLKSSIKTEDGANLAIFGGALGCKSYKQAENLALANLRKFNPEWKGKEYVVVLKFEDK